MSNMTLSEELSWRGFVNQTTFKDIKDLDKQKLTFYFGVDPSAASMTIGNLASAMVVKVFIKHGYQSILLVGGATGLIGDPDGKAEERSIKTKEEVELNKNSISQQYQTIFDGLPFQIVDNYDWFKDINYLDFLRDVGKHVPMRQMLARDFVESRLGEDGSGISYAEFSYSLIQGYDFLHLNQVFDATLQIAGSDQWGNSVAGVDLIRRKTGKEAHVWTVPLIINKTTGIKFGKSEDGAIWLNPDMTSVFRFYQFWLNLDDDGCEEYLKIYTELDKSTLDLVLFEFNQDRSSRLAQKTLAREVTSLVHGKDRAQSAEKVSKVLFGGGDFLQLEEIDIEMLGHELGIIEYNDSLVEMLVTSCLASSNGEARNLAKSGAISLNGQKLSSEEFQMRQGYNIIKKGKNSFILVRK